MQRRMAESLEYFEHVAVQPTRDLLVLLLGPGTDPDLGEDTVLVPAGSRVEVRTRFVPGHWACGYEVAETLDNGYRIRRQGSRDVLAELFEAKDVRVASAVGFELADPPARTDHEGREIAEVRAPTAAPTWLDLIEGIDFASIVESNSVLRVARGVTDVAMQVPGAGLVARPFRRLGKISERVAKGAITTFLDRTDQLMRRGENLDKEL
jgi:hypothetical protein